MSFWTLLYIYIYVVDIVLLFIVVRNNKISVLEKILTAIVMLIPFVSIGVFIMLCIRIRKDLRRR